MTVSFPESLIFVHYDSGRLYNVSLENGVSYHSLKRLPEGRKPCGYAIMNRQKFFSAQRNLHALFVYKGRLFFLSSDNVLDVTEDTWGATRDHIWPFRYRFRLLNAGSVVATVNYREFAPSDIGSPDPHFFVDVIYWLSKSDLKARLLEYWKGYTP